LPTELSSKARVFQKTNNSRTVRHIGAEITKNCVTLTQLSDGDHSVMWQNTQPSLKSRLEGGLFRIRRILENVLILNGVRA